MLLRYFILRFTVNTIEKTLPGFREFNEAAVAQTPSSRVVSGGCFEMLLPRVVIQIFRYGCLFQHTDRDGLGWNPHRSGSIPGVVHLTTGMHIVGLL